MIAAAQILEVESLQKINTPENSDTKIAGISPAGDYLLLTTTANEGLIRYDLATSKTTVLSKAQGAGYNVKISSDGKEIAYRETTIDNHRLRRNNILRQNFASGKRQLIAKGQRDLRKMDVREAEMSVTILDRHIALTRGTQTTMLAPCGEDKSYIWPSISPDGKHLCFYVTTGGCYVSDIDGSHPQFVANACRAAKWYDKFAQVTKSEDMRRQALAWKQDAEHNLDLFAKSQKKEEKASTKNVEETIKEEREKAVAAAVAEANEKNAKLLEESSLQQTHRCSR